MDDDINFGALQGSDDDEINFDALEAPGKRAAVGALGSNPEKAAEAIKVGKKVNVPPLAVEQDPEPFKLQAQGQAATEAMAGNRPMQEYATGNPMAAKVSSDDWPALRNFSDKLFAMGRGLRSQMEGLKAPEIQKADNARVDAENEDTIEQFKAGGLEYERGALGAGKLVTDPMGVPMEEDAKKRLEQIEKSLATVKGPSSLGSELSRMTGMMVPSIGPTFAGMALGSAVPGFGTGLGGFAAFGTDTGRVAAGNKYLDGQKEGLNPIANWFTSTLYGTIVGAINTVGGESVTTPIRTGVETLARDAMTTALKEPKVSEAITKGVVSLAKGGTLGGALMGAQTYAGEIATAIAKTFSTREDGKSWETIFNDPDERARVHDLAVEAIKHGAVLMGAMHLPGVGVNMIADSIHIDQSRLNAKALDDAMKARDATLTHARAPEMIQDFVEKHELGSFQLDPTVALEIHKNDPTAFSFIPNFEQYAREMEASGQKVFVDPAHYLANVGPDLHQALKDDISINEGLSVNEAKTLEENPPKYTDVFHGSPYLFEHFGDEHFTKGEGANTYGQGHYVTEHPAIAEFYKNSVHSIVQSRLGQKPFLINGEKVADWNGHLFGPEKAEWEARQAVNDYAEMAEHDGIEYTVDQLKEQATQYFKERIEYQENNLAQATQIGDVQDIALWTTHIEQTKAAIAHIDAITSVERDASNDLFPTVYAGKLKATHEEMSDLRKSVDDQNEKTSAAVAQVEKEVADQFGTTNELNSHHKPWREMKDWLKTAEQKLGKDRVRQIFIENGIKAHRFETTRSKSQGGEIIDKKTGEYVKFDNPYDEEIGRLVLSNKDAKETVSGKPVSVDESVADLKAVYERKLVDLEKELAEAKEELGKDPDYNDEVKHRIYVRENLIDDAKRKIEAFDIWGTKYDSKRPHNYTVLKGEDLEITARNGVPVPKPEPSPEVKANKTASAAYIETATDLTVRAQAEKRAAGLNGLFADAKAAGMTKVEYSLYLRHLAKAQSKLEDKVYVAAEREAKKRLTPEWKKNYEATSRDVEADLDATPEMRAINNLRKGEKADKLDAKAVAEIQGEYGGNRADYPGDLPKGITTERGGLHPDDVAGVYGFDSGRDLIVALAKIESERGDRTWTKMRRDQIDEEATRRMDARYGSLEDQIHEEAMKAAANSKQIEVLSAELEQIAKNGKLDMPFTKADLEEAVRMHHERSIVSRDKPERYQKAAGSFGRKAELMLLAGKHPEAFLAKQRQMLAVRLWQESLKEAKLRKKFFKDVKPLLKELTVRSVAQPYVDQIQKLFNLTFQMPTRRNMPELLRGNAEMLTGKDGFIERRMLEGKQIDAPAWLTDPAFLAQKDRRPQTLTVEQHREMRDLVTQLIHHGKEEKTVELQGRRLEWEAAKSEAISTLASLKQKGQYDKETVLGMGRWAMEFYHSIQIRPERLAAWADAWNPLGVFNSMYVRGLQEGKQKGVELSKKLANAWKQLPAPENLKRVISRTEFQDPTGRNMIIRREQMLAMALNTGSESNMSVLIRGYGWDKGHVLGFLQKNMTEKDWDFVHGIWRMFDEHLFPEADKNSRALSGVGLKKVEPRQVDGFKGAKLKGGYYPLIESRDVVLRPNHAPDELISGFSQAPTRNYVKDRTGKAYPLDLSLDGMIRKVNEQIHDISYTKPWRDAGRLLKDVEVRRAFSDVFGDAHLARLDGLLSDIASNGGRYDELAPVAKLIRGLRQNTVGLLIGIPKFGTAVIHGGAAAANSLTEIMRTAGGEQLGSFFKTAVDQYHRSPSGAQSMREWAESVSDEVRNRTHFYDRDISQMMDHTFARNGYKAYRAAYLQFQTALIGELDKASVVPTFVAGYRHYISEGMEHHDAVFAAEQLVRNAHGASGVPDLPAILRMGSTTGEEAAKFMTIFGGYFNHNYNQQADIVVKGAHDFRKAQSVTKKAMVTMGAMGSLVGYLLAPALIHSMVRDDNKDEGWGSWAAHAVKDQLLSTQFVLRDVEHWSKTGSKGHVDVAGSLGDMVTVLARPYQELKNLIDKGHLSKDWAQNLGEFPMALTGLGPNRTLLNHFNYWKNLYEGNRRPPDDFDEWKRYILDSKTPPKVKPVPGKPKSHHKGHY